MESTALIIFCGTNSSLLSCTSRQWTVDSGQCIVYSLQSTSSCQFAESRVQISSQLQSATLQFSPFPAPTALELAYDSLQIATCKLQKVDSSPESHCAGPTEGPWYYLTHTNSQLQVGNCHWWGRYTPQPNTSIPRFRSVASAIWSIAPIYPCAHRRLR